MLLNPIHLQVYFGPVCVSFVQTVEEIVFLFLYDSYVLKILIWVKRFPVFFLAFVDRYLQVSYRIV